MKYVFAKISLPLILYFCIVSSTGANTLGNISNISRELSGIIASMGGLTLRTIGSGLNILVDSDIARDVSDSAIQSAFQSLETGAKTAKQHISDLNKIKTELRRTLRVISDNPISKYNYTTSELADPSTRCNSIRSIRNHQNELENRTAELTLLTELTDILEDHADKLNNLLFDLSDVMKDFIDENPDAWVALKIGEMLTGFPSPDTMWDEFYDLSKLGAEPILKGSWAIQTAISPMLKEAERKLDYMNVNIETLIEPLEKECNAFDKMRSSMGNLTSSRKSIDKKRLSAEFAHERGTQASHSSFLNSATPSAIGGSSNGGCRMGTDPNFVQDPRCNMNNENFRYCGIAPLVQICN